MSDMMTAFTDGCGWPAEKKMQEAQRLLNSARALEVEHLRGPAAQLAREKMNTFFNLEHNYGKLDGGRPEA